MSRIQQIEKDILRLGARLQVISPVPHVYSDITDCDVNIDIVTSFSLSLSRWRRVRGRVTVAYWLELR